MSTDRKPRIRSRVLVAVGTALLAGVAANELLRGSVPKASPNERAAPPAWAASEADGSLETAVFALG